MSLKIFSTPRQKYIKQTKGTVKMTNKGLPQFLNFMTP